MTSPLVSSDQIMDVDLHANGAVHELWRWMRAHAPVHFHPEGDLPAFWSLTRHDDIRAVYRDPAVFSSAHGVLLRPRNRGADPGGGLTLALTDPPRHGQLRAVVAERFSGRCLHGLAEEIAQQVRAVVNRVLDSGACDMVHDVATRLSIHGIGLLLGVPEVDRESLLRWTEESFASGRSLVQHPQIMRYFAALMSERSADPRPDALSMLLHGRPGDRRLTEAEVLLNCENLVGAAENAGLSMAAGMAAFLEHPLQWRRLRDAPDLMPFAVEEVLRWTSSATHSMRTVSRPVEVRGRRMEPGDRVALWIPSANRDEAVFAQPYRFDITRRPNRHLALGAGAHVCIGGTMARHQMRILYSVLLETAESIEPAGPATALRSLAVNGPAHLPVRITARRRRPPATVVG
ncbi:cytochrome P450 [Actinomycetes bacterium KLBMP 9797]